MKKALLFLTSAVLLMAGCAKVENEIAPEKGMHQVTLKAYVPEETRVSINNAGVFSWQVDDKISVVGDDELTYTFTTTGSGPSVNFDGTLPEGVNVGQYAFYPASEGGEEGSYVDGDDISFFMPTEYTYVQDATFMPMLGEISSEGAAFKAVGGVLKLIIYNVPADAARLVFTARNKVVTGDFPVSNGVITAEDQEADDYVHIVFDGKRKDNMVFYIPLPTGTIHGFELGFMTANSTDIEGATKTTTATLNVTRNKMIIAPALNMGGVVADDATLTNDDIEEAGLTQSYPAAGNYVEYENESGVWQLAGLMPNKDNVYLQIRDPQNNTDGTPKNDPYIKLPDFSNTIKSVTLHGVYNGSERAFTGTAYFRGVHQGANVASGKASVAGGDIELTILGDYHTGYIEASATCLITAITVSFEAGTPAIVPVISFEGNNSRTIGAGKLNCNIPKVKLSDALDGNGIAVVVDPAASWISSATISGDVASEEGATVTVTAGSYNHEDAARTGKVYLRATGAKEKVLTISQSPSIVSNPASLSVSAGNATFTVSWTGDSKVATYQGYYSTESELANPTTGTPLTITNEGTAYSATPSGTVVNGTTYYIYVKVGTLTEAYADKYAIAGGWTKAEVIPLDPDAEKTATISFGTAAGSTNINSASVSGLDSEGNTWTVTTSGTDSFTPQPGYAQVGASKKPASSIVFVCQLPATVTSVNTLSIKLGGFSGTAGTISLKVGNTVVGTSSLNATTDVTVSSTAAAEGNAITITVTNIEKGVKVYGITTKYQ